MLEINKVHCWDCLELMKQIPDKSVDLVLTDPPYYNIMKNDWKWDSYNWDNQWESIDDWLAFLEEVTKEIKRILANNWSFFIFWDDKNTAYMQVMIDKYFNLENNIVRRKKNNMTIKWWNKYRCYCPITERVLFYTNESRNANLNNDMYAENIKIFSPIIEYMIEQKRKIKEYFWFTTNAQFDEYINNITETSSVVSRHYFTYSQRSFPTKEIWEKLQTINGEVFRKEYEVFRKEYEELRRPFNQEKNHTDVWDYNIIGWSEVVDHPTQKPLEMIKQIINTTSRKWQLVLDPFLWSWTTAVACKELGRNFIGIEKEQKYVDIANKRLSQTSVSLF